MHFDFQNAITLAGLTAAAFHIETEPPGLIAPDLGLAGHAEQFPDSVEHPGVSSRVGTGRTANRLLVDINNLIDMLQALDFFMFPRFTLGMVQT